MYPLLMIMNAELRPSLLAVIIDTNPGAWALLSDTVSLSAAISSILVFINAHLALNYVNKVAVIASHCDRAQWLYPSPADQRGRPSPAEKQGGEDETVSPNRYLAESTKRLKLNVSQSVVPNGEVDGHGKSVPKSNKYRPFRLVEEELLRNLNALLASTDPASVAPESSTMIAGALTMALCHINRETIAYTESLSGFTNVAAAEQNLQAAADPSNAPSQPLDARILLLSVSPSPDLAHQYIPIMNSIFACQRLSIPIDVLQIPLPSVDGSRENAIKTTEGLTASPFLQQASDATHGIYISIPASDTSPSLTTYLLSALLSSPTTRGHLVLPTSISVDFRAACFCHRKIVSIGFVCSICLSIFCEPPENGDCLTCGTHLSVGEYGARPIVVARKKKKRRE